MFCFHPWAQFRRGQKDEMVGVNPGAITKPNPGGRGGSISGNCEQPHDLSYLHTLFIYLHAVRVNNTNMMGVRLSPVNYRPRPELGLG